MEGTMALSAFDDKSHKPQSEEIDDVLLDAARLWKELISSVGSDFDPIAKDWRFSGKQWGWSLRLKHKKRAVLYMTPAQGFFYVGFVLGEKAVAAAHQSALPQSVLDLIDNSQKYAEGRAVRLEVRNWDDLSNALQIASIKMAN
jgi:hypothetical protein